MKRIRTRASAEGWKNYIARPTLVRVPDDLTSGVLRDVSRSFYLTIRVLPAAMREPVGLAYLLARASDTLADSARDPAARRIEWLHDFGKAVDGQGPADFTPEAETAHAGERVLSRRLPECLARLRALAAPDQAAIRCVLGHIIRGQTLDVERFGDTGEMRALPDAETLRDYTYLVAGCVGEFWTETAFRKVRNYARTAPEELRRRGVEFGQGLQLVNILRDLREDLQNNRCYLPADELAAVGLSPADVLTQPGQAEQIVARWLDQANLFLASGAEYAGAVRPWRLRLAVFLPWYLGRETIALLRVRPALTAPQKVKLTRADVRRALWLGVRCSLSEAAWQRVRARMSD